MHLKLAGARRIWAPPATHCAFTDLVRSQGGWLCAFREATDHHSADGSIRVLHSPDAVDWTPAALLSLPEEDLRDPKLVALPEGRVALICGSVQSTPEGKRVRTLLFEAWASAVPRHREIGEPGLWLWRLTFGPSGLALGLSYRPHQFVCLHATRDLESFETLAPQLLAEGRPSEHGMAFLDDGRAVCLLRRDPGTGLVGVAKPPYRDWSWKDLGARIGGPCLVRAPGNRLIAGVRLHDGEVRTALCELDLDRGCLEERLALPSGEDTSYPGMVLEEDRLTVSYYSSHEGPTAIYLANVCLSS
ncbi:MAG: exo-alpha-sialidase [Deltaproteobacteria bacterium]|nr:exo-alpha-sialidase [Deltaproteobacteria bacterium]